MKVFIKNKILSVGGASSVTDENKNPVLEVKGRAFSITRKKFVRDTDGNLLYKVRDKFWRFLARSAFVYDAEGRKIAKVKEKYFSLRGVYLVHGYKDEISVEGQFFTGSPRIFRNGREIGTLRFDIDFAAAFGIADSFVLEAEKEDIPFLTALVVAIDNIRDRRK